MPGSQFHVCFPPMLSLIIHPSVTSYNSPMQEDTRNVLDEFKEKPHDKIISELDRRGIPLEIAIENTLRDYNMGSIVRSANAFGVRRVHVIGRKQWNKRGAMKTDAYLDVTYHASPDEFFRALATEQKPAYAVENNVESEPLVGSVLPRNVVLVFGQEGEGVSSDVLQRCDKVLRVDQRGSTRSLNVAAAAAIAMYEWCRQHA